MQKICFLVICLLIAGNYFASAQTVKVPFTMDRWDTEGSDVTKEQYMGKESILIKSGFIYLKDVDFLDGIIEVDISFSAQRNFPGIAFRLQDRNNYENFYVRPHQSGNPDATQYTPVFNGLGGWQLYYGEGYSNAFTYKFNTWHHIKIDVHGNTAEIYIDDMQKPLINVTELKREWKAGKIGLYGGNTPVHFANLQYTPRQSAKPAEPSVPPTGTDGLVTQYQVSNVVGRDPFNEATVLTPGIKDQLTWTTCKTEPSGTLNLAKYGQLGENKNVMVARITFESSSDQVKAIRFGFSDYVLVYLNDQALYFGRDNFTSRDYRFLGTIGLFDMLFLHLKKGTNELWFVVSEDFGGWGVKAKFDDMMGVELSR